MNSSRATSYKNKVVAALADQVDGRFENSWEILSFAERANIEHEASGFGCSAEYWEFKPGGQAAILNRKQTRGGGRVVADYCVALRV